VKSCQFLNNTCYRNDTLSTGNGELVINWASDNVVRNNIFYCTAQNQLLYSESGNVNNALDHNLWYADAGASQAQFTWRGTTYTGFDAYRAGSGQDAHSQFANPNFLDPGNADFRLQSGSPAIEGGDRADLLTGKDHGGNPRRLDGNLDRISIVDCGAEEYDH